MKGANNGCNTTVHSESLKDLCTGLVFALNSLGSDTQQWSSAVLTVLVESLVYFSICLTESINIQTRCAADHFAHNNPSLRCAKYRKKTVKSAYIF